MYDHLRETLLFLRRRAPDLVTPPIIPVSFWNDDEPDYGDDHRHAELTGEWLERAARDRH